MALDIPWIEPDEVSVGDRLQWKRSLPDFPATEGWTLTYYLRANIAGGQVDIVAATSTADYEVDVSPTVSAAYTAGAYYWAAFVSKSGDRQLVGRGRIVLKPNYAAIDLPFDDRSHARRALESIEAVLEGRATRDDLKYAMQAVGRSVEKMPTADLITLRNYYLAEVSVEDRKAAAAAGKSSNRKVLIRFQ